MRFATFPYGSIEALVLFCTIALAGTCLIDEPAIAADAAGVANAQLAATDHEPLVDAVFPTLKEAYAQLGIEASLISLPGERSVQLLNVGKYDADVIHPAGLEKIYPNLLKIDVPLITVDAIAVTAGRVFTIDGWHSLNRYRVCVRRGIKAIEFAASGLPHVDVINDYRAIFDMLKAGRCDLAVLPRDAWIEARRLHVSGLRALVPPLQSWPMYHYVARSHADRIPALTGVLMQMRKSGVLERRESEFWKSVDQIQQAQGSK
jgi:polar amino acid transport system substrate-binding protein